MSPRFSIRVSSMLAVAAGVIAAAACSPGIKVAKQAEMTSASGAVAADFTAVDHRGKTISLAEENRETAVVLVFYRGAW